MQLAEIGYVKNIENKECTSEIILKEEFVDGLLELELKNFIQVVFDFHQSSGYKLKTHNRRGEYKGIFATRSPRRPSSIGITTVELLQIKQNTLIVKGLDAINGTPVLDIKPQNMGMDIRQAVRQKEWPTVLNIAGNFHGHICPGLALGIKASLMFISTLLEKGPEVQSELKHYFVTLDTANCIADGIQIITGYTIGNKSLIIQEQGKTLISFFKKRDDSQPELYLQLHPQEDFRHHLTKTDPYQIALEILETDYKLFSITEIS